MISAGSLKSIKIDRSSDEGIISAIKVMEDRKAAGIRNLLADTANKAAGYCTPALRLTAFFSATMPIPITRFEEAKTTIKNVKLPWE